MIILSAILMLAVPTPAKLTADLLVTNQPGTVMMRKQMGTKIDLANIATVRRGEPIAALVLFSSCAADEKGDCDVRMDMTVVDPAGNVYGESKDTEVWVGKPGP